jgi:5-formyltetrahydrofolate cyclo-ligase
MEPHEVKEYSDIICDKITSSKLYCNADIILGYYPLGNEVDVLPIIHKALGDGKIIALPRVTGDVTIDFYRITFLSDVSEGSFHVMEPEDSCEIIDDYVKDLSHNVIVLVPGTVFDEERHRYGYGKGFYDRYLSRFPGYIKIGIAFDNQIERSIEVSEFDVSMDYIYTESTIIER